jgi:hypothetical protein
MNDDHHSREKPSPRQKSHGVLSFAGEMICLRGVTWLVRILWPISLILCCVDLYRIFTQPLLPEQLEKLQGEAIVHLVGGAALFLIWFFFVRTWGNFTLNKHGKLER